MKCWVMIKVICYREMPEKSMKPILIKGRKTLGTRTKMFATGGYHREGYSFLYQPKPDYGPMNVYYD